MIKKVLQCLFSIKNENYHKIIRILGFKIKILNKKKNQPLVEEYNIQGNNNQIIIVEENGIENCYLNIEQIEGLKIEINGNNNIVKIYKPFNVFKNVLIELGNDNTYIEIGKNCIIENFHFRLKFGTNQKCILGENITMYGGAIVLDEDASAYIGNNCLFAAGFMVWGSDGHSIINKSNKNLLNRVKKPVCIGSHCWFGLSVSILKNTTVSSNSIVGLGSVVSGNFSEENVILAGNPAKIVKRDVEWDGCSPLYYGK